MDIDSRLTAHLEKVFTEIFREVDRLPASQQRKYRERLSRLIETLPSVSSEEARQSILFEILQGVKGVASAGPSNLDYFIQESIESWKDITPRAGLPDRDLLASFSNRLAVQAREAILQILWQLRWYESAFPVLKISARFAAAAMMTSVASNLHEEVETPWKAFMIELPKGEDVLYQHDLERRAHPVRWIQVLRTDATGPKWTIFLHSPTSPISLNRVSCTTSELLSFLGLHDPLHELNDSDERAGILAGRIVVSAVCAATTFNPSSGGNIGTGKKKRSEKYPTARVFQITEPVDIDLAPTMRNLQLSPGGRLLNIQSVVRGHRKRQPYGPRNVERKWIWIQPYWRGPEEAPIAVRPHVLKDIDDANPEKPSTSSQSHPSRNG